MHKVKEVKLGWNAFIQTKNSFKLSLIFSILLFVLICLIQNGNASLQALSFTSLPPFERLSLFVSTLFSLKTSFTTIALIITVISSILSGISLAVAYEYFYIRKQGIDKSSLAFTTFSYLLVIIGVQCAACSLVIVSIFISVFGNLLAPEFYVTFSSWFGLVGIFIQLVVLWLLLGKLSKPLTC